MTLIFFRFFPVRFTMEKKSKKPCRKDFLEKPPKTQEGTLPEIHWHPQDLAPSLSFLSAVSAMTIAKKFLTGGVQPSLFKFLGRGHHAGKNHLISHLKCVRFVCLNSIDQKGHTNLYMPSFWVHMLGNHTLVTISNLDPFPLFFLPWVPL